MYAFQRIIPFSLMHLYHKCYKSQSYCAEEYHRQRADPYYVEGLEHIVPVRDKHHVHMEYFYDRPQKERVGHCRSFSPEKESVQKCREESREYGRYAARCSCVFSDPEVISCNIAFYSADQSRYYSGYRAEEKACRHRSEISHVKHHIAVIHAEVCREYRQDTEEKTGRYIFINSKLSSLDIFPQ